MKNTELLLRSIIETANDAIITSDSDGNITAWNRAAVDIFGYSHDEIMGKPVITIMPQRSHVAHRKGMRRVTTTGESHILGSAVEILGLRKDGTEIPIELSLAKWTTKDGQFFTAIIRDINRRKRTEEALKESEEKFSRAFHSNPHPMSIVTLAEGHYLDVNDSYVQAFGFSREELLGRTTVEMGILKDDSARKKILHSLKERQAVKNLELELLKVWAESRCPALRRQNGNRRSNLFALNSYRHHRAQAGGRGAAGKRREIPRHGGTGGPDWRSGGYAAG